MSLQLDPACASGLPTVAVRSSSPLPVLAPDGAWLELVWQDGRQDRLPAGRLRAACRCAACTAARVRQRHAGTQPIEAAAGVTITHVTAIGRYALNLGFSDDHARGVFPWSYLQAIAAGRPLGELAEGAFR
jgi:DUF971 family protein